MWTRLRRTAGSDDSVAQARRSSASPPGSSIPRARTSITTSGAAASRLWENGGRTAIDIISLFS
jgi:hypothetical protein